MKEKRIYELVSVEEFLKDLEESIKENEKKKENEKRFIESI